MAKEMNEYIKKIIKEEEKTDKTTIDIRIRNEDDILSPFCSDKLVISPSLAEYIESRITRYNVKKGIVLNIYCKDIDNNEKEIYDIAIRNRYKEKLIEAQRDIHKNNITAVVFLIVGLLILVFSILSKVFIENAIWAEVIDIIAWVFIWESVEFKFIQRIPLSFARVKAYELINAKINFIN